MGPRYDSIWKISLIVQNVILFYALTFHNIYLTDEQGI